MAASPEGECHAYLPCALARPLGVVGASDGEEHLLDILDQVENPDDCEWHIYGGPLFIDFRLLVEWSIQDDRHGTPGAPAQIVSFRM